MSGMVARWRNGGIFEHVDRERIAQDAKFGQQSHPDGTGLPHSKVVADASRLNCQARFEAGDGTWNDILREEFHEALAEAPGSEGLRAELIQIAAVCVAWVEDIDRRSG